MIEHRFVSCAGRRVMVRRAGSGPPVVLLHESPRSSAAFIPMIEALAERFTVIAPDTPGYGGSDPLALHRPQIPDYAGALGEMQDVLGLERVALFGRHTGAAIAIEFANLYPERVSGIVLDGCPAFTPEEMEELVASYLPPFRPVWDGSHVAWLWSRVRDQLTFFPWNRQGPASRLAIDMPRPSVLNRIATDLLLAGDGYRVAYEAAFRYDGAAAAATARVPAHYMATETDVLLPHLNRLPDLPTNARIHRVTDAARVAAVGDLLAACVNGLPPAPPPLEETGAQRFVQVGGASLLVRQWGDDDARPLLLVADLPGSTSGLEPVAAHLAKGRAGHRHRSPRPRPFLSRTAGCGRRRNRPRRARGGVARARASGYRRNQRGRMLGRTPRRAPRARLWPPGAGRPAGRSCGPRRVPAGNRARAGLERLSSAHRLASGPRVAALQALGSCPRPQRGCRSRSGSTWRSCTGASSIRSSRARHSPRHCARVSERPWPAMLASSAGRVAVVTGETMPDAAEQAALAASASARVTRAVPHPRGYAGAIMAATDPE